MQHFQQRFSPIRLAVFSLVTINFSILSNNVDQFGSVLAQDQVTVQPSNLGVEIKDSPEQLNINSANKLVLQNQIATVFNSEIKEIYTANFSPKLPPQPTAQNAFTVKAASKSKPSTLSQNLNQLAKKIETVPIPGSEIAQKAEPVKLSEIAPEVTPVIDSQLPQSLSELPKLEPVKPESSKAPVLPILDPAVSELPKLEPIKPESSKAPVLPILDPAVSELPKLEPVKPEPIKAPVVPISAPVIPEPPKPEPIKPESVKVENAPKLEPTITAPEVPTNNLPKPESAPIKSLEPIPSAPTVSPNPAPTLRPAETAKPSANTPGTNSTPRVNASNSTVFDTGIRQTPALTIPTTPSQIKLDRTQAITLQEALQIAETNSQPIKQAAIAVQRARAVVEEAVAARNPNLDLEGRYSFSDSADARQANIARSPLFADNSTITQPLSGTVQLSYNVFTSGLNEAQIKAAEERLRATEADLTRVRQSTFLDITNAYIDLQDTDETVRIRSASVNARQLSLKDTQSLERAGVGTKFDVLQSEVQLSNAQQQLLSAQNNQQVRRRSLAQQLQYPPTLNLSAADKIEPAADWKLTLEDTILQALRNRSELDIQKLTASAALNQAKAEIARLGPQVQLTASYDLRDNFSNVGGISMGYTLGARVSWRLLDGGVAGARVKQFESDRDLAESRFDQSATQIRLEVESAYFSLVSTRDQIKTSAKAVLSAAEALRLARLRLTAGVGTQLEVIRAEEDLTQAEVNRSTAIIGFNRAVAALQRSLNTVTPR